MRSANCDGKTARDATFNGGGDIGFGFINEPGSIFTTSWRGKRGDATDLRQAAPISSGSTTSCSGLSAGSGDPFGHGCFGSEAFMRGTNKLLYIFADRRLAAK
mmetsp:Transcript_55774/g.111823  ORF Transcript_55774/g.111823 Transcript_55774/m.111823 type:complete len:103 (-) Transcript_55774:79-387(-)